MHILTALLGCTHGPDGGDPNDTAACQSIPVPLVSSACVQSAPPAWEDPFGLTADASVHGTVTEIGPGLTEDVGAATLAILDDCSDSEHQMRIVDESGVRWTLGWGLAGNLDNTAPTFSVGQELDLVVRAQSSGYSASGGFLLADAGGPLLLLDRGNGMPEVDAAVIGEFCRADGIAYHQVQFGGDALPLVLVQGESGLVLGRNLEAVVVYAQEFVECSDGCSSSEWMAWEAP